jgi:serine phosphatase RsbU (regulator of sigma subunit)
VPDVPGLDVAAVYRPGGHAVELVGGDWYDVLPLPGGHVAVVVGDVMGRGVHAATTMASVSAAVRAYALLDPEPATLLACLDEFVATHAPQQFVTLFYGLLDTGSGRLRFVLAGHLPPLLVLDGDPLVHPGEAGPPLGLPGVRPVHECLLGCGHGIVVVTDGVVERRDRSIDDGFELARRAAAGHERSVDVAAAVAGVAGQAGADGADDVTVVALRREPAGRDGRAPATRP